MSPGAAVDSVGLDSGNICFLVAAHSIGTADGGLARAVSIDASSG